MAWRKAKIKCEKSRRGYTLNIPKDMVLQIFGEENKDLDVELFVDLTDFCIKIRNANIPKNLPEQYKAGLFIESIKRKNKYNQKIAPKQYEKRMKEFKQKIKEKQIKAGIIEDYRKLLKGDKVYIVKDGIRKKMDNEERLRQLKLMGED